MTRTIIEAFVLLLLSAAVGLAANAAKSKQLKLTVNYFPKSTISASALPERPEQSGAGNASGPVGSGAHITPQPTAYLSNPGTGTMAGAPAHPKHEFQEVSTDEAVRLFKDPKCAGGLYVFVDARNDEKFAEGRIPGAVQCDHYYLDIYLDTVLERCNGAEKVIVYCNGGSCDDSIYVCRNLRDAGVPPDAIYLYAGGWTEWTAQSLPIESGGPEGVDQ